MNLNDQKSAPIYEALEKFRRRRVVPFDVPGHKEAGESDWWNFWERSASAWM